MFSSKERYQSMAEKRRGSNAKKLLGSEEDEIAEHEALEQAQNNIVGTSDDWACFHVKSNRYEYPREKSVPADMYFSTIVRMEIRRKDGKRILDVFYDFEDRKCDIHHVLQSYPEGSLPFQRLANALAAAGVDDDRPASDGVGVTEIVRLDYVSRNSGIGSIVERKPYVLPPEEELEEEDQELIDRLSDDD